MKAAQKAWFESLDGCAVKDYDLISFLGSGKIGFVYKAQSRQISGWEVALKLTPAGKLKDEWQHELQKVSKLSTITGVVHFHGLDTSQLCHNGHTELVLYTVWDYIPPGRNLKQHLANTQNKIHTSFLVAVIEQVLRILHACQKKGVVRHGDLHSGNILIGDVDEGDIDALLQP